jgi:hypothetical protein
MSHTASPVGVGYFGDPVSLYAQGTLEHNPHVLYFLPLLGWQVCTTMPSFFLLKLGPANFLPRLASNFNSPNVSLPSNSDEQQCATMPSRGDQFLKQVCI